MDALKSFLLLVILATISRSTYAVRCCKQIQNASVFPESRTYTFTTNSGQPYSVRSCKQIQSTSAFPESKTYTVTTNSGQPIEIYCEMGLNGGGYTFLSPESLRWLTPNELSTIFTDPTSFLLRVQKTDGSQPYAVLTQLLEYSQIPLKLGLSEYIGYKAPKNLNIIGQPFLYYGFLPAVYASNKNVQGLNVNGYRNTFRNCDRTPNSHFTLYPNFPGNEPSIYYVQGKFCNQLFAHLRPNTSGRKIPPKFFFFGETHWGGCGCYKQTNQLPNILSFNIGFR